MNDKEFSEYCRILDVCEQKMDEAKKSMIDVIKIQNYSSVYNQKITKEQNEVIIEKISNIKALMNVIKNYN